MADTPQANPRPDADEPADAKPSRGRLARLADPFRNHKRLWAVLGVLMLVPIVGISCYRLGYRAAASPANAEISLGEFRFDACKPAAGQVADASFALHLALLDEVARPARQRLQVRAFRVEQDIEELLRRAHSTDFDDPSLAELKRQLQEQINRTLGLRAIADVIVTNLQLDRAPAPPVSVAAPAESLSWGKPTT